MMSFANLTKGEGEAAAGSGVLVTLAAAMMIQAYIGGRLMQPVAASAGTGSCSRAACVFDF